MPGYESDRLRVLGDDEYPTHVGEVLTIPTSPADVPAQPKPKRRGLWRRSARPVDEPDERVRLLERLGVRRDDFDPVDFWAEQAALRSRVR